MSKLYSVSEIVEIFDKTPAWFYWAVKNDKFVYENGDPIEPTTQSEKGSKRHYSLDSIQEIALSLYRNKTLDEEGLRDIIGKILIEREKSQKTAKAE